MSIVSEMMIEDEERRIAAVRKEYEARIAELEEENATLRRDLYALSDAFTSSTYGQSTKTVVGISASHDSELKVGGYFKWEIDPTDPMLYRAVAVSADSPRIDGVAFNLSEPGKVYFMQHHYTLSPAAYKKEGA